MMTGRILVSGYSGNCPELTFLQVSRFGVRVKMWVACGRKREEIFGVSVDITIFFLSAFQASG